MESHWTSFLNKFLFLYFLFLKMVVKKKKVNDLSVRILDSLLWLSFSHSKFTSTRYVGLLHWLTEVLLFYLYSYRHNLSYSVSYSNHKVVRFPQPLLSDLLQTIKRISVSFGNIFRRKSNESVLSFGIEILVNKTCDTLSIIYYHSHYRCSVCLC